MKILLNESIFYFIFNYTVELWVAILYSDKYLKSGWIGQIFIASLIKSLKYNMAVVFMCNFYF